MRRFLFLLLAGLSAMASAASEPVAGPKVHLLNADVEVSAGGEVVSFAMAPEFASVEAAMRTVVESWRFQPATRDGQPVSARTSLALRLTIDPAPGAEPVRVELVGNGAGAAELAPPVYPATPLKARAAARILLDVDYDAAGAVTAVRVINSASTRREYLKQFEEAATTAAQGWRFRPEQLDGVARAGTVVVPLTFQFTGGRQAPALPPEPAIAGFDPASSRMVTRSPIPLARVDGGIL